MALHGPPSPGCLRASEIESAPEATTPPQRWPSRLPERLACVELSSSLQLPASRFRRQRTH
ncbi:Hypothetical protein AA314_00664 [Archangium gephyra]|uniref:Uncharacterized protein n=1 Tax=Archangium gephyra TaxID=48 RepID=A0AAC8TAX3_9BACT|nr:Hypothetical protein AA314_00664 [Archangium gephyra]